MNTPKAMVLCGGEGKRLRPITYYLQKTMIPVGPKQKPLLEYVIRLLKFHGLTDITLLVNHKAAQICNFFGDGSRFKVEIQYVHDNDSLKGTGGSAINALEQGAFSEEDTVLVYYGDIITDINLGSFLDYHAKKKAMATVALASGFEVRVGLADLDEQNRIRGFVEKPKLEKPVSIGILAFNGAALKEAQSLAEGHMTDLMGDIIPHIMQMGKPVYGFLSSSFWYDIGSIEAYEKLDNKKIEKTMSFLF